MRGASGLCFLAAAFLTLCSCGGVGGPVRVVSLEGSWEEMGRQYGEQVSGELKDVLEYVNLQTKGVAASSGEVERIAGTLYELCTDSVRAFLDGVAATSGLTLRQLKTVNAVEYAEGGFACSALAVWGPYTGGPVVMGRNYDAHTYLGLRNDVIVTVFHPSSERNAVAIVGYAGEIYAVNAMNSKGVFLELNNGVLSGGAGNLFKARPAPSLLLEAAFGADDLAQVQTFLEEHPCDASYIIGAACPAGAKAFEWCYAGVRPGSTDTPDGMFCATNHFVNPEWPYPAPEDSPDWQTYLRRRAMLRQAARHRGAITAGRMRRIMSTPVRLGGPFHRCTRYQLVVEPETSALWIRVPGRTGWHRLELSQYLDGR